MFVLAFYEASQKSTPAKAGFYEGDRAPGIEIHLKQAGIDKSGPPMITSSLSSIRRSGSGSRQRRHSSRARVHQEDKKGHRTGGPSAHAGWRGFSSLILRGSL
jgi:hypothetical protein